MGVALVLQGLFSFLDVFYYLFKVVTFIYNLMYLHGYRLFFMWHLGAHGGRGIYIYFIFISCTYTIAGHILCCVWVLMVDVAFTFIYLLYLHNCRLFFVSHLGADGGRWHLHLFYLFTVTT